MLEDLEQIDGQLVEGLPEEKSGRYSDKPFVGLIKECETTLRSWEISPG